MLMTQKLSFPKAETEEQKLQLELNLKQLELSALLEITQAINSNLPEKSLYKIYHFTLLAQLKINKLALFVNDEDWECKVCFGTQTSFAMQALPAEIRKLTDITSISKISIDKKWREFDKAIPVIQDRKVLAYVLIGNSIYKGAEATSFVQTLSNILIVAMENRKMARQRLSEEGMRNEIRIAREVQAMLFPKKLPNDADVAIHASYLPHSTIGGDYYDFVQIDHEQLLVCIADVSGKGVPASLLMSNFQAGLRTILRQTDNLEVVVSELNHLIYRNAIAEKFITAFLAIYNRTTRELHYVNAGHNSPVLLFENNSYRLLTEGCTMLGILEELPFMSVTKMIVPHKAMLMCYTDGLTEVFNKDEDEYGLDNTIRFLQKSRFLSLETLHKELINDIRAYNQGSSTFSDDVTLLSCRFK